MSASYVYIITNRPDGVLYIGVTSDLKKRIYEHQQKLVKGFSRRYNLTMLVYYEIYDDMTQAIHREKMYEKMESGVESEAYC